MGLEAPRYFTQKDLEPHLSLPPGYDWREMIVRQEVLAPTVLVAILEKAKDFLITQPGPNLARRQRLTPPWFDYWQKRLQRAGALPKESRPGYVHSEKLMPFKAVADFLKRKRLADSSGVLFVAGAEGHEGHRYAADYMAQYVDCSIWVFEQDSYLRKKVRKAPFLSLGVRLSMWDYSKVRVLTVSPQRPANMRAADHYQNLFKGLGATYSFADSSDPNCWEKVKRGYPADFLIMPHLEVERTTKRVQKLMGEPSPGPEQPSNYNLAWLRILNFSPDCRPWQNFWEI